MYNYGNEATTLRGESMLKHCAHLMRIHPLQQLSAVSAIFSVTLGVSIGVWMHEVYNGSLSWLPLEES